MRAAKLIALLHTICIVILLAGLPAMKFWPKYAKVQLVLVSVFVTAWIIYCDCPFTIWENTIRKKLDPPADYEGPCISYYVKRSTGFTIPARTVGLAIWIVIGGSVAGYLYLRFTQEL